MTAARIAVDPTLLGYAARYALGPGRHVFAAQDVTAALEQHADALDSTTRGGLIFDIQSALRDGGPPERHRWQRVLDLLVEQRDVGTSAPGASQQPGAEVTQPQIEEEVGREQDQSTR